MNKKNSKIIDKPQKKINKQNNKSLHIKQIIKLKPNNLRSTQSQLKHLDKRLKAKLMNWSTKSMRMCPSKRKNSVPWSSKIKWRKLLGHAKMTLGFKISLKYTSRKLRNWKRN